jgi:transcriptional regulator with XRE-family HTH domain
MIANLEQRQLADLVAQLNWQREQLGLSCAALARRAGLSLRTVQRVLAAEETDPGFATMLALAECLGVKIRIDAENVETVRRDQAQRKARRLVSMVQATSALESQAISPEAINALEARTVAELLGGSSRRLWAE